MKSARIRSKSRGFRGFRAGSPRFQQKSPERRQGGSPDFDSGIKEYINSDSTALANNGGNDQLAAVSAMGYDAYFVALEAIKAAGTTEAVKNALPSVNYTGVTGAIAFGENGDANRTSAFIKKCNTETAAWDLVREQGVE